MTAEEILKNYSILDDELMDLPRTSIFNLLGQDNLEEDRCDLIDFMNTWADDEGNEYYYDMLSCTKFILENTVAYTTPNKIVHLNYECDPAIIPHDKDRFRRWYFVYCHECLHQYWDTFGVGAEIKKAGLHFDHELLNIASDCVINDFLSSVDREHKVPPLLGVFPDSILKEYGVKYDRKYDTQFSLYRKLLETLSKEQQDDLKQKVEKIEGKLEPKKVNKKEGGGPPPPGPQKKHTPDFIKGYTQAIKDTVDGKIDPTTMQPLEEKGDYEKGYNTALAELKEGLENGINISNGNGGNNQPNSDLPEIPWDKKTDDDDDSDSNNNDSNDSNMSDEAKKVKDDLEKTQKELEKAKQQSQSGGSKGGQKSDAQKAADDAKQAAQDAADAANDGDEDGAEEAASQAASAAQRAANSAKESAERAQKKADESGSKAAQDAANAAKKAVEEAEKAAKEAKNATDPNKAAKAAADAAEAAQKAADAAQKANEAAGQTSSESSDSKDGNSGGKQSGSDSGNSNGGSSLSSSEINDLLDKAIKNAEDAAAEAEKAAEKAKKAADKNSGNKKGSELAKNAAEEAKEAAEKAKKAAQEAKNAKGDADKLDKAIKAAEAAKTAIDSVKNAENASQKATKSDKELEQEAKSKSKNNTNQQSHEKGGKGDGDISNRELEAAEQKASKLAEETIKKHANSMTGTLGEFAKKCKASKALKKNGLMMDAPRGAGSWDKDLKVYCKQFVLQKLKTRKEYRNTYNRIKRGERAFTSQDLRNGRIVRQGREELKNKIGFDICLYVDVSGSMSGCINNVFTTAYSIVDKLKNDFGKEKIVDKSKIELNAYVFTTSMRKITWGTKCRAEGGTYQFEELVGDIYKNGSNAFLNIILTDGDFGSVNNQQVADNIKKLEGLFIMVTNNRPGTFDNTVSKVKSVCGFEKLRVLYADSNFSV